MTTPRQTSYLICLAVAAGVIWLHLGPAVLGGLLSYTVLTICHRWATKRLGVENLRWGAVALFAVVAAGAIWMLAYFVHESFATLPKMIQEDLPQLTALAKTYGVTIPYGEPGELRDLVVASLGENFEEITKTGGVLSKTVFHVFLGIFAAVLAFTSVSKPEPLGDSFYDQLRAEMGERTSRFLSSFERVFGAQVAISAINTLLTGAFLLVLGFPNVGFLVAATFLVGLLPIIGNLVSNTLVVGTALTMSFQLAVVALVFLVVIHKLEYFLNSRIVGASIQLPMWQTLLGILVGESILGLPGIVIAPAIIHYVREELIAVKAASAAAAAKASEATTTVVARSVRLDTGDPGGVSPAGAPVRGESSAHVDGDVG